MIRCVPFVQNRTEIWKLHNLAKTYGKLPSEALFLTELSSWEAYQLNNAVFTFGRLVENEVDKAAQKARSKKKAKPEQIEAAMRRALEGMLEPDRPKTYRPMAMKAVKVKLLPGQDPADLLADI